MQGVATMIAVFGALVTGGIIGFFMCALFAGAQKVSTGADEVQISGEAREKLEREKGKKRRWEDGRVKVCPNK